jgi:hypothetical protein
MRAPHPAFSLDLAPSDFYRFGKLKMAVIGAAFADDERMQGIMEVFNGSSREELEAIFEEWLIRFDRCPQQNGEYVEWGNLIKMLSLSQLYPVWPCQKILGHT